MARSNFERVHCIQNRKHSHAEQNEFSSAEEAERKKKRRIKVFYVNQRAKNEDSKPAPLKVYEKKNSAFAHRPTAKKSATLLF
jgi:hypothetical protein